MKPIHLREKPTLCHCLKSEESLGHAPTMRFFVVPPFTRLLRMTWGRAMSRMTWKKAVSGLTLIRDRGLTILEVLVAIAILSFGILAIATMQASSIKGNSQAISITEGITLAQSQMEALMRLPYNDANLADTDGDGTDANPDANGANDNGGDYGLNDTGAVDADHNPPDVGRYQIYYNVAVGVPVGNVKTIRVIVLWTDRGAQKKASVDFMKSDII